LSRKNDIPQAFLQQIMLDMKEQGWVTSVHGREGGYELALSPDKLTMGRVVRFFESVLAPIGCVSVAHFESCSQESVCRFRRVLLDVRNHTAKLLDETTLATLAEGSPVSEKELAYPEFTGGLGI
jgi:Rrf2 family protein